MNDWLVVLTPLLVLPIILLFRFVGCGLDATGIRGEPTPEVPPDTPPDTPPTPLSYHDTILGVGGLVSYWRLVEDGIGTGIGEAIDEKGANNGDYVKTAPLPQVDPGPAPADPDMPSDPSGSEAADGDFAFNQPGLIDSEPLKKSVRFKGGFVQVAWEAELHSPAFTIEAWVLPLWVAADSARRFDHVLIDASEVAAAQSRGFRIYANQFDRWQVRLNSDPSSGELFPTTPFDGVQVQLGDGTTVGDRTHVAVTYDGTLRLYLDGELVGQKAMIYGPVQSPTPLYIGVATPEMLGVVGRKYPFLGRIQEVAIYNKALSAETIGDHYKLNPKP